VPNECFNPTAAGACAIFRTEKSTCGFPGLCILLFGADLAERD